MDKYLTFRELCWETDLSKYRLRYYQSLGYFQPAEPETGKTLPDGIVYHRRWLKFWEETLAYFQAGLSEFDALSEAYEDVFGHPDR
jgi:hypothetical protein